jgi:hypothetical protein
MVGLCRLLIGQKWVLVRLARLELGQRHGGRGPVAWGVKVARAPDLVSMIALSAIARVS